MSTTEPATNYHESVEEFRRTLVRSSAMWEKNVGEYLEAVTAARASEQDPAAPVRDAYAASLMAMGYSYTLAAVLKVAQQEFGEDVSRRLASKADDILTNGDFDDLNADVMPEAGK